MLPGGGKGHYVNFSWDNDAPVITVTSSSAINNELQEYVLKGLVKEASQDIKSVVSFKGGLPDDVAVLLLRQSREVPVNLAKRI